MIHNKVLNKVLPCSLKTNTTCIWDILINERLNSDLHQFLTAKLPPVSSSHCFCSYFSAIKIPMVLLLWIAVSTASSRWTVLGVADSCVHISPPPWLSCGLLLWSGFFPCSLNTSHLMHLYVCSSFWPIFILEKCLPSFKLSPNSPWTFLDSSSPISHFVLYLAEQFLFLIWIVIIYFSVYFFSFGI